MRVWMFANGKIIFIYYVLFANSKLYIIYIIRLLYILFLVFPREFLRFLFARHHYSNNYWIKLCLLFPILIQIIYFNCPIANLHIVFHFSLHFIFSIFYVDFIPLLYAENRPCLAVFHNFIRNRIKPIIIWF